LCDLVEARPVAVGPVLAEAGDAREDDARVDLGERLVVDAEAELHIRAIVLHQHVGGLHQPLEYRARGRELEIQGHRALVAVQVLHVGAVARAAHALVRIDPRRRFDLDHVGAEVGELAHAARARAYPRPV
jgi:hypothetical protein